MKRILLIIMLSTCWFYLSAQTKLFVDQPQDSVVRLDPRTQQSDFVPGQILIKFQDEVLVSSKKNSGSLTLGLASIDAVLKKYQANTAEKLFPNEKQLKTKTILRSFNGMEFEKPSLHNIYKLSLPLESAIYMAIEELKQDPNVVYAEPNYIMSITDDKALSPPLSETEMKQWLADNSTMLPTRKSVKSAKTVYSPDTAPDDPLYPQQWYIPAVNADLVWDSVHGADSTQIIAILDTGVDWLHPDLQNKIWTNPDEIPDNGIDDDGNGKVDDVRGWDWINNDNNPTDDNSHGTHVAGIAAAESNNGVGISGVSQGAKIMALKVFQSSGYATSADITQGIYYATQKGATVINMSFGSYARSYTMEDALVNAYATIILVAAAGNDGLNLEQCLPASPFFPAALSFVLGVQAPDGSFSNIDCNGPTFSAHPELFNYEMKAPGTNIISTIPNGGYRVYQGTSMSAPVLSGALAMYRPLRPQESMELMWVKLIQSTNTYVDVFDALNKIPIPEVWMISQTQVDTMPDCDNDSRVDAGETIKFWFTARNTGGQCDSTWFKIRFHEFEDTTTAQIIKPTSYIGSMSAYATRTSQFDPMILHISQNVVHNRDIVFDLLFWYQGSADTTIQTVIINVENGEELSGIMDTTLVLTPDKLWLASNSFRVGTNGVLIIRPGTKIIIYEGKQIQVRGIVLANGTKDSLIVITGNTEYVSQAIIEQSAINNSYFSYCKFINFNEPIAGYHFNAEDCIFEGFRLIYNIGDFINNQCVFYGSSSNRRFYNYNKMHFNNFIDRTPESWGAPPIFSLANSKYNNFISTSIPELYGSIDNPQSWYNSFIKTSGILFYGHPYTTTDFIYIQNQYLGTTDSIKIDNLKYDFIDNPQSPYIVFDPLLASPPDSCHAITWKILVNGADAQDEYVEPVGVGPQRFDVYFNREMDTIYTPQVSFGVRYPYTQQAVADSGRWDTTHKIWTAYKTIQLYTGDGINRVRVAGAREETERGWEIPVEDMRFEFLINAAGSASIDFIATPGIGKVNLEWPEPDDLPTLLGYNMYRFQHVTDTTFGDTTLVNTSLINDTLFSDFNVQPQERYYYMYKIVRTDFTESDYSKVVNAIVLTASTGDANGDLSVNVLDITTIVSYMLNQNPSPFLFDAADVNYDDNINVLDIIGLVDLIYGKKNSSTRPLPDISMEKAYYSLKDGKMNFESKGNVAGLQLNVKCKMKNEKCKTALDQLKIFSLAKGFEFAYGVVDDEVIGILYSMSGKELPEGVLDLFRFEGMDVNDLEITEIFGGDVSGDYVPVLKKGENSPVLMNGAELQVNPNPFNYATQINYTIPEEGMVTLRLFDLSGAEVKNLVVAYRPAGRYSLTWNGTNGRGQLMEAGIYLLQLKVESVMGQVYRKEVKVVLSK